MNNEKAKATGPHTRRNRTTDRVRQKVEAIFQSAFGARGVSVCKGGSMIGTMQAVKRALAKHYGEQVADEVSFHLTDWGQEAAILVALHLFPERFTAKELECAVEMIASHAPYHVAGMAEWLDCSVADCLPDFKRDILLSEPKKKTRRKNRRSSPI